MSSWLDLKEYNAFLWTIPYDSLQYCINFPICFYSVRPIDRQTDSHHQLTFHSRWHSIRMTCIFILFKKICNKIIIVINVYATNLFPGIKCLGSVTVNKSQSNQKSIQRCECVLQTDGYDPLSHHEAFDCAEQSKFMFNGLICIYKFYVNLNICHVTTLS